MAENQRIEDLRRRIQKDPASIAFAQLAEECRRAGQCDESVEICRAGLAIHPGYLSARVTLGRALVELNQLDEALEELAHVLASAPENLAAIRGVAEIHHRRGNLSEALLHYRAALALARNDPDLQETVNDLAKQVEPPAPLASATGLSLEQMTRELFANSPPPAAPAGLSRAFATLTENPPPASTFAESLEPASLAGVLLDPDPSDTDSLTSDPLTSDPPASDADASLGLRADTLVGPYDDGDTLDALTLDADASLGLRADTLVGPYDEGDTLDALTLDADASLGLKADTLVGPYDEGGTLDALTFDPPAIDPLPDSTSPAPLPSAEGTTAGFVTPVVGADPRVRPGAGASVGLGADTLAGPDSEGNTPDACKIATIAALEEWLAAIHVARTHQRA